MSELLLKWKTLLAYVLVVVVLVATPAYAKGVFLSVEEREKGVFYLEGTFQAPVSSSVAWGVLSDYDHISDFVSSMKKSRVIQRDKNGLRLEQEGKATFFLFSQKLYLLLDVREEGMKKITFIDTAHRTFKSYEGSWGLQEKDGGVTVIYKLKAKPQTAFFARSVMTKVVRQLLSEVRAEMLKRRGSAVAGADGMKAP